MNLLKYLLPCAVAACSYAVSLHADDFTTVTEARETDSKALTEFVKSKSRITIQEKGGNLMISGDIHAEWDHTVSETNGHHLRGEHKRLIEMPVAARTTNFGVNEFDTEVNLIFAYKGERTWATIQMQFDNPCGITQRRDGDFSAQVASKEHDVIGSGRLDNIVMRKAFMGYNVFDFGTSRFDIELGHRRLYDVFDSKVQFYNMYDGLTLRYANSFESIMDFNAKAAVFVVDSRVNHYAWIAEFGFLNLIDTGLDFKYSYIDWNKHSSINAFGFHPHASKQFRVSQWTLEYNLSPDLVRAPSQIYGAYLFNHDARGHKWTQGRKERQGFYVGFKMGEVKKQNDWAFDMSYQWVQTQCVSQTEALRGIGRDNPPGVSLYSPVRYQNAPLHSGGFANFKGYNINTLYALTNNLTFQAQLYRCHQCNKIPGGRHRQTWVQLQAIYAF